MSRDQLNFTDYILDNIHGYIALTHLEAELEKLPVFRRLRGIKQLGLTNWIFPGAEHTRYSHSLGVMHMADKMAERLGFSVAERQLIRVSGMLHDIGHYPLSHVGERAYKKHWEGAGQAVDSVAAYAAKMKRDDAESDRFLNHTVITKSGNPFHHESVSERVIRASGRIRGILEQYGINPEDVCHIITGEIINPAIIRYVQLLHSEMDADRIDYLLRDTFSSGTAYGAFEINTLIKSLAMTKHPYFGVDLIGVNAKGILSADQFLINRYFAYSQVFYHKYVSILSFMAERIMGWFLEAGTPPFPDGNMLNEWIGRQDEDDRFFNFTDSFFMNAIGQCDVKKCPGDIAGMIDRLNHYLAPDISEPAERHNVLVSGRRNSAILDGMAKTGVLELSPPPGGLLKIEEAFMTEHVPEAEFKAVFAERGKAAAPGMDEDALLMHRLVNGVSCVDSGGVSLLVDAKASLMQQLCRNRAVFFRTYQL